MQTIRVNNKIRVNEQETHYYNPETKIVTIIPRTEALRMVFLEVSQEDFDNGTYDCRKD